MILGGLDEVFSTKDAVIFGFPFHKGIVITPFFNKPWKETSWKSVHASGCVVLLEGFSRLTTRHIRVSYEKFGH